MERIPNAVYTKELREEAVKLVTEQGLTIPDVGRRLSIPKSTISYWVREEKKGKLSSLGSSKKNLTETEMELTKIKRELAQVKMERDMTTDVNSGHELSFMPQPSCRKILSPGHRV